MALADAGDVPGAIAAHEAALARDPSLARRTPTSSRSTAAPAICEGRGALPRGAARSACDLGEAHYDYGVLLGLQEKWDLAADAYRKALALNPAHAQAHNNLGQMLERSASSRRRPRRVPAGRREPADVPAGAIQSRAHAAGARTHEEAIAELDKLSQPEDAETPRYMFALSAAHVRAGHRDEGIKWATEARRLALEYGQQELAAIIERELAKLK